MKFKIKVNILSQSYCSAFVGFGLLQCAEFIIFLSITLLIQPSNGGSLLIPASHQQHQNSGHRMANQYHRHRQPHAIGTSYSLSPNTATPAPDMENRIKSKPVTNEAPRFMLGMLNGLDKNWSFKKPGFFGTPTVMSNDPITDTDNDGDVTNTNKYGTKDSLFCRLSKRQSLIMFSFCMADKKVETDTEKDKNSNSISNEKHKSNLEQEKVQQEKSHRQIASENNNKNSNNNRNKKNKKGRWRISVAEYSSESHDNNPNNNLNPTSPIRKDRVKKKGGGNSKGKMQKVTTQQNQQQQIEINEARPKVQVKVQNQGQEQGQGQGQSGWGQQTTETSLPLGKQDINDWPDAEFSESENNWNADPQDEMSMSMPATMNMQMGTQDAEAKTEPPPMSSGSSNLQSRLPGKPKIILKSDASIQILYELSLDDLKKVQGDGQFHKKLENMRTENFEKLLQEHL